MGHIGPYADFTFTFYLVDLQLDGTFSSQDKESDEVDGQIADSEVN